MTAEDIVKYYADLLILQYLGQPRAYETIKTVVRPVIMDQLPTQVQDAFNIGTAVGAQLDIIGTYVGVSRSGYGFTGPITLDDDDFTQFIRVAIIRNQSGSSLSEIQNLLFQYFPMQLLVFDHANMSMSYFMNSSVGSLDLAELFVTTGLLPKPMGVELAALIYVPDVTNLFGFRTYDLPAYNVSPFNTYDSYDMDAPWLSYSDAVII